MRLVLKSAFAYELTRDLFRYVTGLLTSTWRKVIDFTIELALV